MTKKLKRQKFMDLALISDLTHDIHFVVTATMYIACC